MPLQDKKKNILQAASKSFKGHIFSNEKSLARDVDYFRYFTLSRTRKLGQGKTTVQPIILLD